MKKRYVLAALAAMTVLAGCGDNASQQKNTDNTTQESTAEDDLTAADPDEDGEELDPEFSQDVENNEVIDADDAEEEAALDPITPSEYLVQNASDYVTLGDYDGVEVTGIPMRSQTIWYRMRSRKSWQMPVMSSLPMHLPRTEILYI